MGPNFYILAFNQKINMTCSFYKEFGNCILGVPPLYMACKEFHKGFVSDMMHGHFFAKAKEYKRLLINCQGKNFEAYLFYSN